MDQVKLPEYNRKKLTEGLVSSSVKKMENIEKIFRDILLTNINEVNKFSSIKEICELLELELTREDLKLNIAKLEKIILLLHLSFVDRAIESKREDDFLNIITEVVSKNISDILTSEVEKNEIGELVSTLITWSSSLDFIQSILVSSSGLEKEVLELTKNGILRLVYSRTGIELSHELDSDSKLYILLPIVRSISMYEKIDFIVLVSNKVREKIEKINHKNWLYFSEIISSYLENPLPAKIIEGAELINNYSLSEEDIKQDENFFNIDNYLEDESTKIIKNLSLEVSSLLSYDFKDFDELVVSISSLQDRLFNELCVFSSSLILFKKSDNYSDLISDLKNYLDIKKFNLQNDLEIDLVKTLLGIYYVTKGDFSKYVPTLIMKLKNNYLGIDNFKTEYLLSTFNHPVKLEVSLFGFEGRKEIKEDMSLDITKIREYASLLDMSICSSWLRLKDREFQYECIKYLR